MYDASVAEAAGDGVAPEATTGAGVDAAAAVEDYTDYVFGSRWIESSGYTAVVEIKPWIAPAPSEE